MVEDEIEKILSNLTPSQELLLLSKIIGFKKIPPTVDQILDDEYYLGKVIGKNIYPIWRERLKEIYPDPIRTSCLFVIAKGAIGTGKSTFSRLIMFIDLLKLTLIDDPFKFLGLDPSTQFTFRFFNVNLAKAQSVFVDPFNDMVYNCEYFNDLLSQNNWEWPFRIYYGPASRPNQVLSEALMSCVLSEINFMKYWVAEEILDTVISRLESRFQRGIGYLNHIVLDSSDTTDDSIVENFIKNSPYRREMKVFSTTIWDAKKHLGIYFKKFNEQTGLNYFEVYTGDSNFKPFIIRGGDKERLKDRLDLEKIIKVPEELREIFETDIELALQEKAGISVRSGDLFFRDKDAVLKTAKIPVNYPEHIILSFSDKNDTLMDKIKDAVLALPDDRYLYCRIDLGISHDNTGLAIVYLDRIEKRKVRDVEVSEFYYIVPIALSIGRHPDEETPIDKIRDFFIELSTIKSIRVVSTDQYQSTQLRQELRKAGINTMLLSVDKNSNSYNILKNLIYRGHVSLPSSKLLLDELLNLVDYGNKIDHKANSSKDIADAVAGAIDTIYSDEEASADIPSKNITEKYVEVLRKYNDAIKEIQKEHMIKNLLFFNKL